MSGTVRYIYRSQLGCIAIEADGDALVCLRFVEDGTACNGPQSPVVEEAVRWLDAYFAGKKPGWMPKVQPKGTPFQQRVWQELLRIPYGQTISYGELARRVGCRSAQAVGQAVGRNPIAIIIPCHRVVGADGSLTGYAYGLERKQTLIQLETNSKR